MNILFIYFFIFLTIVSKNAIDSSAELDPPEDKPQEDKKDEETKTSVPDFSKEIYILDQPKSKLVKGYEIPFGISFKEQSKSEINFQVEDRVGIDISKKIDVKREKDSLLVKVTLIEDIPNKLDPLILYIKAKNSKSPDDFKSCKAIVNIEDETKPKPTLKFEKQVYDVEIVSEQTGLFLQIKAILTGDENDRPSYNLKTISDDKLRKAINLDKDNGGLSVISHANLGVYDIKITAKSSKNNLEDETTVKLTVKEACKSPKLIFTEAFAVRNVPENQIVQNILPGRVAVKGCEYKVISQIPLIEDLISLEKDTGAISLKSAISIEATKIIEIYVELQIVCDDDNKDTKEKINEMKIPITDVKNDPQKMILKIVIEKEKSGPPKFTPNIVTIGYPKDYDFITEYPIRLLTTVSVSKTEDEIAYSIKELDCPFVIDSKWGYIYPRRQVDKDLTITVVGKNKITDKEGEMSIQVKLIETKDIVKVVFKETLLQDIPSILRQLSKDSNLQILELSSKSIPEEGPSIKDEEDKKPKNNIPKFCTLIYAIKDGKVFPGVELAKELEKNDKISRAEEVSIKRENPICNCTKSTPTLTIVLIIIAVMTIMGSIITLMLWYRSSRFNIRWQDRSDNVSRMRLSDNTENISHAQWSTPERPFDMMASREFRINDGGLSRDQNDEVVIMGAYGGTSTFRPRPTYNGRSNEAWENTQVNSGDSETELYAITKLQDDKKNEVAVLPVISLPPPNDRKRKRVIKVDDKNTDDDDDLSQAK